MIKTETTSVTLLLPEHNAPTGLLPGPTGQLVYYALPLGLGFQMPLPEAGKTTAHPDKLTDHDWHCYLGSR